MIKYTDLNKIFVWGCLHSLQDKHHKYLKYLNGVIIKLD